MRICWDRFSDPQIPNRREDVGRRWVLARFAADEPITLHARGRDDHDASLLEGIAGDARLPEPARPCLDASGQHTQGQDRPGIAPHPERTVGLTRGIGEERKRRRLLVAERARLLEAPVANHRELRTKRSHGLAQETDRRDLLPAEQASEVANEHQHRGLVRPQLAETDLAAVGIEDRDPVQDVRHPTRLQRLTQPFLKAFAVAAAERELDAIPQDHGAFAAER